MLISTLKNLQCLQLTLAISLLKISEAKCGEQNKGKRETDSRRFFILTDKITSHTEENLSK